VDHDETQNEILFVADTPEYLFGSMSYLEFPSVGGEMVKFHLARVKAGYQATIVGNEDIVVNCYAECLDISAALLDSFVLGATEYQAVRVCAM
jgi:hypothetical protein